MGVDEELARGGAPPARDERLAAALRFIGEHYREPMTVDQIAAASGM